jgi:hypothetical protein
MSRSLFAHAFYRTCGHIKSSERESKRSNNVKGLCMRILHAWMYVPDIPFNLKFVRTLWKSHDGATTYSIQLKGLNYLSYRPFSKLIAYPYPIVQKAKTASCKP